MWIRASVLWLLHSYGRQVDVLHVSDCACSGTWALQRALALSAMAVCQDTHLCHHFCFIQAFGGCVLASLYVAVWTPLVQAIDRLLVVSSYSWLFSSCWQLPWYASSKGAAFVQAWSQFFVAWLCSKAVKVNVESRSTKDISSGWKFASCSPMALGSLCTGQKVHLAGVPVRILFSWSKWCRTWENPYSRSFVLIFLLQILCFNFLPVRTLRGLQISWWQIRTCDNFSMPLWFLKAWTWCQWRRSWRWTTTLDVSVIVANS